MTDLERLDIALKIAFNKLKITKKGDMAVYLGYKRSYFSDITRGASPLSDNFMQTISDKLNINSDWVRTGVGEMLKNETPIDASPPIGSGEVSQTQLDIMIQALDRLTKSEANNSENVKELIAQGRQQTDNITRLIDLLCQKGVDVEDLVNKEKGGLKTSGGSNKNSASDADRANVG